MMIRSKVAQHSRFSQRQVAWWPRACFSSNNRGSSSSGSGGGGRSSGGGGGRASSGGGNINDRRSNIQNPRGGGTTTTTDKNKDNFEKNVLQPAARGELRSSYKSGIPRLAARKHKAHLEHPKKAERLSPMVAAGHLLDEEEWDEERAVPTSSLSAVLQREQERERRQQQQQQQRQQQQQQQQQQAQQTGTSAAAAAAAAAVQELEDDSEQDDFYAPEFYENNDDKYYWMEEDYDPLFRDEDDDDEEVFEGDEEELDDEDMKELAAGDEDEDEVEDRDAGENEETGNDEDQDEKGVEAKTRRDASSSFDPEQNYLYDQNDIFEIAAGDDKDKRRKKRDKKDDQKDVYDPLPETVLPLRSHGPELEAFLQAINEHPTTYARIEQINLHPHSKREPKPLFPRNRAQPPKEFVESYCRFLYVTGLPAFELDGEVGDLENPNHRIVLQKTIARIVGVDSTRVFPANTTSAFVGLDSPKELAEAIKKGPVDEFISSPPDISVPDGEIATHDFVKSDPDRVLLLSNMPPGNTATSLLRELFPVDAEVGAVYDGMSTEDFQFLSSTRVLIRFASRDHAKSALDSHLLRDQLNSIGQYKVRYFRARRELLHAGFDQPTKSKEIRKPGTRLIVDGDMPSRKFYLSHAGVVHLRNVDPMLTKEEISKIAQPFCAQIRDIQGSIEFITCHAGLPTGEAYIGFDLPGEAETFMRASKGGRIVMGDRSAVQQKVHDRRLPGQPPIRVEKRLERTEEELLDDLNNWEKYVDPADLEQLHKAGISKTVLDEAMRSIRFGNATFGPLDSALRSEALEPEKESGELYKEMVQLYIEMLKDCLPSKEDVGPMYELLHFPDEPIDLGIFDREKERQRQLEEKRQNA